MLILAEKESGGADIRQRSKRGAAENLYRLNS